MPDLKFSFKTKVVGIIKYNNFNELINDFDIEELSSNCESKETLLKDLEGLYSKDMQNIDGVLAIKIEII